MGADGREEIWALRPVRVAVFDEAGLAARFVEMVGWDDEMAEAPAGVVDFADGSGACFIGEPRFEVTEAGEGAIAAHAGAAPQAVAPGPGDPEADEDARMAAALDDAKAGMGIVAAAEKHGVKMASLRGKFAMWKSRASDAELLEHEAARERFNGAAS